jgi:DNA polymerase III sliding clamp (beta) subunit (PCNA family)
MVFNATKKFTKKTTDNITLKLQGQHIKNGGKMIDGKILSRLAKGVSFSMLQMLQDETKEILNTIHFKDNYAEVCDGRMLIREVFKESFKEELLSAKDFKPVKYAYPDTQKNIIKTMEKPVIFRYALSKKLLVRFLATIGKVDRIIFEFRDANGPCYFKTNNGNEIYGLLMPMRLPENESNQNNLPKVSKKG